MSSKKAKATGAKAQKVATPQADGGPVATGSETKKTVKSENRKLCNGCENLSYKNGVATCNKGNKLLITSFSGRALFVPVEQCKK